MPEVPGAEDPKRARCSPIAPARPTLRDFGPASRSRDPDLESRHRQQAAVRARPGQQDDAIPNGRSPAYRKVGPAPGGTRRRASTTPSRNRARPEPAGHPQGPRLRAAGHRQPEHAELVGPGLEPILVPQDREHQEPHAAPSIGRHHRPTPKTPASPRTRRGPAETQPGSRANPKNGTRGKSGPSTQSGQVRPTIASVEPQRTARNRANSAVRRRARPRVVVSPAQSSLASEYVPLPSRLSFFWATSSSQIPGGWPPAG